MGVLEGSSELGYSKEEYNALTEAEKKTAKEKASEKFKEAGADYVIDHMGQLASLIDRLENYSRADKDRGKAKLQENPGRNEKNLKFFCNFSILIHDLMVE